MDEKKEIVMVKLYNKGKRVIQVGGSDPKELVSIKPESSVEVTEDQAQKLLKLFDTELICLSGGQDAKAVSEVVSGKIKDLENQLAALKEEKANLEGLVKSLEESNKGMAKQIEELSAKKPGKNK